MLVKALEEHGSDLNAAMKSLYSLEKEAEELGANKETLTASDNPPTSGDGWVELLVREVSQSSGSDDAKLRASRVLEALEKMLSARAREDAGKKFQEVKALYPLNFYFTVNRC